MRTPPPSRPPSRRPGGRSARVRADVLAAVGSLLLEGGFDAVSVDAVAERSGVHRATVYRRWRNPSMLLVDLLEMGTSDDWEAPDTGSLEGDLIALNRQVHASLSADRSIDVAVVAASLRSPEAAVALRRFWDDRYRRSTAIVERAMARGEVSVDCDAQQVLVAATGPLYHARLLLGRDLTEGDADHHARSAALGATTASQRPAITRSEP